MFKCHSIVWVSDHFVIETIIIIHFKISGDPCNLMGSQQCDLFKIRLTKFTLFVTSYPAVNHVADLSGNK